MNRTFFRLHVAFPAVALALAVLACNARTNQPDMQATVHAVYLTITAQAATAGIPITATAEGDLPPIGTTLTPAAGIVTPTFTLTPPDSRTGNGPNLTFVRCPGSIVIDGDSTDWNSLPGVLPFALTANTYGSGQWTGTGDLSGQARACWTDSALYLLVEVTDDAHVQTEQGATAWKGDEVEIMFDGDLAGDFYGTTWDGDDVQLGLSPGNFGDLPPSAIRYHPVAGLPQGVEVAARRPIGTGGNYVLEARIPWDELGIMPQTGQGYGLCIALSDNDHAGEARQDSMVSHCPRLRVPDPTTWVTVQMAP